MSQIVNPDPYPCQSKIKPISANLPQFPKPSLPLDGGGLGWGCNLLLLDNFLFTLPPTPSRQGRGRIWCGSLVIIRKINGISLIWLEWRFSALLPGNCLRSEVIAQQQHNQGYQGIQDILLQDAVLQLAHAGKAFIESLQRRNVDQFQHRLRYMAVKTGAGRKYP